MRRTILICCAAAIFTGAAQASDIPSIDSAAVCERQSRTVKLPDRIANRCRVATMLGYQSINACLDDELQKAGPRLPSYSLFDGNGEVRYWTHAECMEARNGGRGVCISN